MTNQKNKGLRAWMGLVAWSQNSLLFGFRALGNGLGLLLLGLCVLPAVLAAQSSPPQDSTKKIKVESSVTGEYFLQGDHYVQKLTDNVRLRQGNTLVFCDVAILDGDNATLKGNVLIQEGDTVRVFADSALYFGETRQSDLFGNVVLVNGRQELYTSKMHYDVGNKIATYHTGATLSNGHSQLTSTHGYYDVNQKRVHFKGDVLATDPEFTMRTDTMVFDTENQLVHFVAPTLISQQGSKIYTEGGFYDIENKFAEFDKNPQYERDGQRGKSKKMRYNGATKEYILEEEAYISEPAAQREVKANVIRYNTETEKAVFVGDVDYRDSSQTITGQEVRYDSRNKQYQLTGRGRVSDPPNIIEADSIDFNDVLGNGMALGNVIWQDTASDYTLLSFRMDYNKQSQYLHAYGGFGELASQGRPLLKSLIDNDTLFMSADTLTSFKPDSSSDNRLLLAYQDVRIFKTDLQAVCDSLTFNSADSIFRFFKLREVPVIWSDTSQFSADTIRMLLKDKKLDRIWLRKDALVINSADEQLFNQIKGRNTTVYFRDNEAREMLVEGNAQALYYALDDQRAYVGVNETECSEMRLYFGNNQVESIKFYTEPKGKFVPIKTAGPEGKKLDGFFWEKTRRPRSLADLLLRKQEA
ncbi:MAG: LPS export ABC transporter periplasmic protein LptC, partial [Saprospiraceae bacterium]|nr:LPS export ABC transporter periplasmic protein LptC [Saprospiraceae bacterium]